MNIHNNTPFRHQVMNPKKKMKKKKKRSWWWQILAEMADLGWATLGEDRSELREDKEREKQTCDDLETGSDRAWDWRWQSLRLTVTELEAGSEIVWWWRWQRLELEVESVSETKKRVRKGEKTEAVREMDGEWDGWVWNIRGSRVFLVYIYI